MKRNALTFSKDSFLGRISDQSWNALTAAWSVSKFNSGQLLIGFQDDTRDVFFVLDGRVRATLYTQTGREVSFHTFSHGDCIGEFSAIDMAPRSSDVVAQSDCIVARLNPAMFQALLKAHPDLSYCLLQLLVGRLRSLSRRVVDFNAKTADERLRESLLELAERMESEDSALIVTPPTQAELASTVFASRESVAREMGRLRKNGLLERRKRALFFPSVSRFREYVAEKLTT